MEQRQKVDNRATLLLYAGNPAFSMKRKQGYLLTTPLYLMQAVVHVVYQLRASSVYNSAAKNAIVSMPSA
jgi:hypothetical protein